MMRLNIKIRMNMEEDMRVRLKIRMKMEEDIGKNWLIIFKLDGFKLDINRFLLKNVEKNPITLFQFNTGVQQREHSFWKS